MRRVLLALAVCGAFLSAAVPAGASDRHSRAKPQAPAPGRIIGIDNRVASTDPRVGRLTSECTAWLISAGLAVTANHCSVNSGVMLEFNVPPSTNVGDPQASSSRFRFHVSSYQPSGSNTPGDDWQLLRVDRNSAGESAFDLMKFFRLSDTALAPGMNLENVGYGIDFDPPGPRRDCFTVGNAYTENCNAQSETEQADIGPVAQVGSTWVSYGIDTEQVSSGGPVFLPGTDWAVAVHRGISRGPCQPATTTNCGTLVTVSDFETAVEQAYEGSTSRVVFVDAVGSQDDSLNAGTPLHPYRRLSQAAQAICPNSCPQSAVTVLLVAGNYEGQGFTSPPGANLVLIAPSGTATIGPVVPPLSNVVP